MKKTDRGEYIYRGGKNKS